jgi:hypothetical protein
MVLSSSFAPVPLARLKVIAAALAGPTSPAARCSARIAGLHQTTASPK